MSKDRGLQHAFETSIRESPVTILEGGRAVGKSTLCGTMAQTHKWPKPIDLSDPEALAQLRLDPLRYLRDLKGTVVIDEAQLEPSLPLWVKRVVDDRAGRPGQFVLTGSARLGRTQLGGSDPLAGRAQRLRMWSMTEAELGGFRDVSAARLFAREPFEVGTFIDESAQTDLWLRGGLPGIPGVLAPAGASTWARALAAYVDAVVPLGASPRVDHARLLRAFRYIAANPAQLLNVARMASELDIKADTATSYIDQLETSFLLFRAEALRPSEHKVLTAHPRIYCSDVGLSAWAMGLRIPGKLPNPLQRGSLLENRVAVSLSATAEWGKDRIAVRHWRDQRAKREVDLLLVHPDGRTVAIEVKASMSVGPDDIVGISAFAAANPDSFKAGYLVYTGDRVVDLTPKGLPKRAIIAVPVAAFMGLDATAVGHRSGASLQGRGK